MPRFKTPDYGLKMIPVDFQRQVLPGSFEFALCHLVDKELDLSAPRSRFRNDAGGPRLRSGRAPQDQDTESVQLRSAA